MKKFVEPAIEIEEMQIADVITTSNEGGVFDNETERD